MRMAGNDPSDFIGALESTHLQEVDGLKQLHLARETELQERLELAETLLSEASRELAALSQQHEALQQEVRTVRLAHLGAQQSIRRALVDQDNVLRIIQLFDMEVAHNSIGTASSPKSETTNSPQLPSDEGVSPTPESIATSSYAILKQRVQTAEPLRLCRLLDLDRFEPERVLPLCLAVMANLGQKLQGTSMKGEDAEALRELLTNKTESVMLLRVYFEQLEESKRVALQKSIALSPPEASLISIIINNAKQHGNSASTSPISSSAFLAKSLRHLSRFFS